MLFKPDKARHDLRGVPSVEKLQMYERAVGMLKGEIWEYYIVAVCFDEGSVTDDGPVCYGFFEISVEQLDFFWYVCCEIVVV